METLKTIEEIAEKILSGLSLVIFTKSGCPNCIKTEAAALELVEKNPQVKVYKVECVQEQNAINDAFMPSGRFIFPVVHSFENGNHVKGTVGFRNVAQLEEAWISLGQMKIMYFDFVESNRRREEVLKREIIEFVPVKDVKTPQPMQDPQDAGCDSCQ